MSLLSRCPLCLLLALLLAPAAYAQPTPSAELPPWQPAPLAAHLHTVNPLWAHHLPPHLGADTVAYPHRRARLQAHFATLLPLLQAKAPAVLTPTAAAARHQLLDSLAAYADRGRFPLNPHRPHRQPVFVDHRGVYCAVGELMRVSGFAASAHAVHDTANLAYVDQLANGPLLAWANQHGLSQAELALIQPGYPPTAPWTDWDLGTGLDLRALYADPNTGHLLVGGSFASIDGQPHANLAAWTGQGWQGLGTVGAVNAIIRYQGTLVVGGQSLLPQSANVVAAAYNPQTSTWTPLLTDGGNGAVHALHVWDGRLVLGGFFDGPAGASNLAFWDGNALSAPAQTPQGAVHALATWQDTLWVGGDFVRLTGSTAPYRYAAAYAGQAWKALPADSQAPNAPVYALAAHQDTLWLGGALNADSGRTGFGLCATNGQTFWGYGLRYAGPDTNQLQADDAIHTLLSTPQGLYIGGHFRAQPFIGTYGQHLDLYRPDGQFEAQALLDGPVHALAWANDHPHAAGPFEGGVMVGIDSATLARPLPVPQVVSAGPNPAAGPFRLALAQAPQPGQGPRLAAALYNLTGQRLMYQPWPTGQAELVLDVAALPKGVYLWRVEAQGQVLDHGRLNRP